MFYEKQPELEKNQYKKMLSIIGNLTFLFSEKNTPYLPYRAHENIFCKYFNAENLARFDCSADAKKANIGIGLKTWIGNNDQKIAEFGRLREKFKDLNEIDLAITISNYRNERIRITKNMYKIDEMIYHIIKRIPNAMQIIEYSFDYIDINNIKIIKNRGNINNTYYTDGNHTYHFSKSKNTLYMLFDNCIILDQFDVEISTDPYNYLMNISENQVDSNHSNQKYNDIINQTEQQICIKLYSTKSDGTNHVYPKSGLNQWNADGRKRHPDEIYIPYPKSDRILTAGFFPNSDCIFNLKLPDNTLIKAKICQQDGKAIMSNPNKVLGNWLLRNVFNLPEFTLITYEMLCKFDIGCVIFTKENDDNYRIDFANIQAYDDFYQNNIN